MTKPTVLVVEDEPAQREVLAYNLGAEGFAVLTAATGAEAELIVAETPPDVILLDWMLPEVSGIELCRRFKTRVETRAIPIVMLSARGEEVDRVRGLETGADDYVVKPFQIEEIRARLNALLRRAAGFAKPTLDFAHISLDTTAKKLTVHGAEVELTAFEYKVLEYLLLHPGKVVSKTELTEHLYEQDHDRDSNVLEVFIRRLRQKLDPDETLKPIDTIRGQGYRFNVPASKH